MSSGSDRCCTNCGKSVEDLPYQFWLFHTCRSCAADASPDRWGDGLTLPGTYRKWRYYPEWHMNDHPFHSDNYEFDESDFPEMDIDDALYLERQLNMHGRERVVGWLSAKVGLPLRMQVEDDPDEDAYYEALADHLIISDGDSSE